MVWVMGCWKEDKGGLREVQHSGACEVWGQRTNAQAVMLALVLASLHMELVFGLAHLEVGVYFECRPISNNILSEVIAR